MPLPFLRQDFLRACCLLLLSQAIFSCSEGGAIGLDLQGETQAVQYSDTVTVNVSTVLLDSVVTSGTGTLLFGNYPDAVIGETTASAYFQLNLVDYATIDEEATYDSVKLILPYSGYSYGDTTSRMNLQVHQLEEAIETKALPPYIGTEVPNSYFYASTGLYNVSSFQPEAQPLATHTFAPRPASGDSIEVTLPDEMGRKLLALQKNGGTALNAADYKKIMNGFRISASGQKVILGVTGSGVKVRLYYTNPAASDISSYDFALTTGNTQFNQVTGDYGQSVFKGLKRGQTVSSTATNDMAFAQSGTGIMVKLDFPYLAALKSGLGFTLIHKAVLEVVPVTNTNRYPSLPPQTLALYQSGETNVPGSPLLKDYSTTEAQTATYQPDAEFDMQSKYRFVITEYLDQLLAGTKPNNGLLVAAASESFLSEINKINVGGQHHAANRVRLRIFYTKLNQ